MHAARAKPCITLSGDDILVILPLPYQRHNNKVFAKTKRSVRTPFGTIRTAGVRRTRLSRPGIPVRVGTLLRTWEKLRHKRTPSHPASYSSDSPLAFFHLNCFFSSVARGLFLYCRSCFFHPVFLPCKSSESGVFTRRFFPDFARRVAPARQKHDVCAQRPSSEGSWGGVALSQIRLGWTRTLAIRVAV